LCACFGFWFSCLKELVLTFLPAPVMVTLDSFHDTLESIPDGVLRAIPLTLLSTLLGVVVVPQFLFIIDDFFQWIAVRRYKKKVMGRNDEMLKKLHAE
jgi:hypothetical protein